MTKVVHKQSASDELILPVSAKIKPASIDVQKKGKGPSRTTKESHKLVIFPHDTDAEANITLPGTSYDLGSDEESDAIKDVKVRRVTAYCTAEAMNFKDLSSYLASKRINNFVPAKKFDEVLYTCYSRNPVELENFKKETRIDDIYGSKLAAAVASDTPIGEIFFFDYGVTVIWGLDEEDEKNILREIIPFEVSKLDLDDVETESFKFCHNPGRSPRLFNDIINLKSGHYMVKMTISHAIAQSVKLTIYEELVENTILATKNIPRMIAHSGKVTMPRKEITQFIGKMFVMKINVNLVSNVLDTPEIFWYEPAFIDLYKTVRGYLEISQRVEVLNQRCNVISDLLVMLRDHINGSHAEMMEWIIIILICIEVVIGFTTIYFELTH